MQPGPGEGGRQAGRQLYSGVQGDCISVCCQVFRIASCMATSLTAVVQETHTERCWEVALHTPVFTGSVHLWQLVAAPAVCMVWYVDRM